MFTYVTLTNPGCPTGKTFSFRAYQQDYKDLSFSSGKVKKDHLLG